VANEKPVIVVNTVFTRKTHMSSSNHVKASRTNQGDERQALIVLSFANCLPRPMTGQI
jgi:hypothetical protein